MTVLTPEENAHMLLITAQTCVENGAAPDALFKKPSLKDLIAKGCEAVYREVFGNTWYESLADHHREAIEWHFESRLAFLEGRKPEHLAYFPVWPRGHAKSSLAERLIVVDAMLSVAFNEPGFALYIGREKDKIKEHIGNIEQILSSEKVRLYAPSLSQVARNEETNQKRQWTGTFLHTQGKYVVKGGSIESAQAGSRVNETRPTVIVPDDIDGREDSPVISQMRMTRLTKEILPMRQQNTLVFFAQNLISRYSVMYQIQSQQVQVLTNRKATKPIPAVIDLVTTQVTGEDGIIRDVYVSGQSTWPQVWDIDRINDEIQTEGLDAFKIECHPAGTRVRLGRHDNVPIEHVRVGDAVLTHENRLRRVTDLVQREYTGDLYTLTLANASVPLQATANHPLLVGIPPTRWRWQGRKKNPASIDIGWHKVADIPKGAYLLEPLPTEPTVVQDGLEVWSFTNASSGRPAKGTQTIRATPELFRLLGYYLAEGRAVDNYVSLTFHEHETAYIEDVLHLFTAVFGVSARTQPDNGHSVRIVCSSAIAAAFFKEVGVGSHFKKVPDWAFMASNDLIKELVLGYWRGDGCKDPSGFAYNTVSEQLAEHIRLLLLRLGVVAGLYRLKERDVTLPQGTRYRRSLHWQGDINGSHAVRLGEILGVPHPVKSSRASCFIHGGYVWRPIRRITKEFVEDFPVFNFEVEEDESYIAQNVISHNCQHDVHAAKEGLLHKNYDDHVHAISYSQFASVYGKDAWKHWFKIVANDWARTKTKYHANVAGYLSVSSADTVLPGITFLIPFSFKADSAPADVAERLLSTLTPYAYGENGNRATWRQLIDEAWKRMNSEQHFETVSDRWAFEKDYYARIIPKYSKKVLQAYQVRSGVMSHSEDKVRDMFNVGFGFGFRPSNPGKTEGLESIDDAMRIDYSMEHPFPKFDENGRVKGYSRFFVLCPDDLEKEPIYINGVEVYPPVPFPTALKVDTLHDSDLFRYQMCNRRFLPPKLMETGERIDEPEKLHDDFGQMLQMVYITRLLKNIKLEPQQQVEALISPSVKEAVKTASTSTDKTMATMTYEFEKELAEEKLGVREVTFEDEWI